MKADRSPNVAVRDGRWKLLVNADGTGAELYDLTADPREAADLASSEPAVAAGLTRLAPGMAAGTAVTRHDARRPRW